jgi:peptide-methionine (R)-S-oxide reductase
MNTPVPANLPQTEAEWRAHLAAKGAEPVAFEVTRHAATERPFTGKYDRHWQPGQYRCICCDAELFSSDTKFDAGCGWPSFYQAAREGAVADRVDNSHGMRKEGYVLPVPDRVPADTRQKLCTLDLEKIFSDYFKSPEIMETLGQRVTEEVSNLQRLNLWFSTLLF